MRQLQLFALFSLLISGLYAAETIPPEDRILPNQPFVDPTNIIIVRAIGLGVTRNAPINRAQEMALAKRAAILDGYRQLGEKLHGIKITSRDTVQDAMLMRTEIRAQLNSIVRGADVVETIWDNGLCQVEMEVKIDARRWNKIFYAYSERGALDSGAPTGQ
ncbi:MAG: hypothetical protein LBN32_03285 [Helicobacteraceae bacterium]|nr:hypothetical protein [Helicobacteraceae bacterium]